MGVRGLQTFVRENRGSLCRSVLLPERDPQGSQRGSIPLIVDAWGVIFKLYLDSLPWASGGEYLRFYQITKQLITAWRKVGLEPTFVFDGAAPIEKHPTILKRMTESLSTPKLFYATSVSSRSEPSFGRGYSTKPLLPPFASHAFIFALHRLGVATHHVPSGEADSACVTMAERIGGYVLGQDTDFLILVGKSERVAGYVPLDMLSWIEGEVSEEEAQDDKLGQSPTKTFRPAYGRRKKSHTPRQSSLLPPPNYHHATLVMTVIPPQTLRQRLRLPANYMALFASLVGNDYTPPEALQRFYEPSLDVCQRIEKAARVLREQLFSPSANSRRNVNPGDFVVELVRRVVKKLCIWQYDTEPDLLRAVNSIIEAALQYTSPHGGECCPIYPFCGELDPLGSLEAYAAAQRKGSLLFITHGWLYPNRIYLRGALEDPTMASPRTLEGSRGVRLASYVIAEEGLGGFRFVDEPLPGVKNGITPAEMQEDTELRGLLGVGSSPESAETDLAPQGAQSVDELEVMKDPPRVMVEYVRQGSAGKIVPYTLDLPPKKDSSESTPVCLRPLADRLQAYLGPMQSDTPAIRLLPSSLQPLVAIIRHCVIEMARLTEKNGRATNPAWRRHEAYAVLKAGVGTFAQWRRELDSEEMVGLRRKKLSPVSPEDEANEWPTLERRHAHLIAQLSNAMMDSTSLSESLLLLSTQVPYFTPIQMESLPQPLIGDPVADFGPTHLSPFLFFSGINIHSLLNQAEPPTHLKWKWTPEEDKTLHMCWHALIDELEDGVILGLNSSQASGAEFLAQTRTAVGRESAKRSKKKAAKKHAQGKAAGMFDLLGDMTI
ncbi:hypothetical protein CNBJ1490 [Cryptococcus deneoformans B-3501A]|uniref:hypothetical protein n=1 Tax=Cryptococcus deneoformans (strain B-3501A) TaxID=283643 RepID=UPI000042F7E1|nr:hypothetical protein CNBJ1490 [Cryptococcus neoformans var. neoformans B-3501A]EAL18507.1 hypothetical protein CNBJ1490 [Cryptococcus neoformans var. neoformans B-3501A]